MEMTTFDFEVETWDYDEKKYRRYAIRCLGEGDKLEMEYRPLRLRFRRIGQTHWRRVDWVPNDSYTLEIKDGRVVETHTSQNEARRVRVGKRRNHD